MKYYIVLFLVVLTNGCRKDDVAVKTPACILSKIDTIKNQPVNSTSGKIFSYKYNGATVYYIPPLCCDMKSQLFDENCNVICNPDGGYAVVVDDKCADFFKKRSGEKVIWTDDRL